MNDDRYILLSGCERLIMKKENDNAFHPHLLHHMAGFQKMDEQGAFNMKGFMKGNTESLKEQELFYRATDYRGS
jgi:hypothetical protein